jgi:hypothetical protein
MAIELCFSSIRILTKLLSKEEGPRKKICRPNSALRVHTILNGDTSATIACVLLPVLTVDWTNRLG